MEKNKLTLSYAKLSQIIKYGLFFIALLYIIMYLWIACHRLKYPFELEWIEGGMVDQVQRIINGQSMYVAPNINFVPFLYTPLYFYVSAFASTIFGIGLFPLRLISFLASLVSFVSIFLIVREVTKNWWAAFLSTGLFAASFQLTGAWLDIARVDSLFIALWLLFLYFVIRQKSLAYALLAGVLAAMAFLTKQTALLACLPVIAYLFWENWKRGLTLLTTMLLIIGITTWILNQSSNGWYTFYIFRLQLQQTEWLPSVLISFWNGDLFVHVPLAIVFVLFFLIRKLSQNRLSLLEWLSILIGALAAAFITKAKVGGYYNVLLPAYAAISIFFGLGLNELLKKADQFPIDYRARLEILIYMACLSQFIILYYSPNVQIPTKADLNAGYELVQFISHVNGNVYLPDHGYLSTLAGKKTYAHQSAIWDVIRGNQQTMGKKLLMQDLDHAIREQIFDVIIFDSGWNYCCTAINEYYVREGEIFTDPTVFYPVTGWSRRPTFIYVAKRLK